MQILVAVKDPAERELLSGCLLEWGLRVVTCADGIEALPHLQGEDPPDVAILDHGLAGHKGVELCRLARRSQREKYTYFLLVTARGDLSAVLEALDAGADDHLSTPLERGELKVRLRVAKRILNLQGELHAARGRLHFQAIHDVLTGALNRGALMDALYQELARAGRLGGDLALMVCDLDELRGINDRHGHLVGDAVLREVATRLRAILRPYDLVGRYGGEEFIVLLPQCGLNQALSIAERMRQAVSGVPVVADGGRVEVTASFGVVSTHRESNASTSVLAPSPDALLVAADEALGIAKRKGRNRVESGGTIDVSSLGEVQGRF